MRHRSTPTSEGNIRRPAAGVLLDRPWGFDHRSLTQPVEIVTGDRDAGVAYARVLARELSQGRLTVFEGGHGGIVADPGASAVLDALDRAAD